MENVLLEELRKVLKEDEANIIAYVQKDEWANPSAIRVGRIPFVLEELGEINESNALNWNVIAYGLNTIYVMQKYDQYRATFHAIPKNANYLEKLIPVID